MVLVLIELVVVLLKVIMYWLWAILTSFMPFLVSKKDISGKLALVTGAGSGIGALMARRIAKLGAKVVLWDVNAAGNEQTAAQIREDGGQCIAYTVDLSDPDQIDAAARRVTAEVGVIDILVNNAGIVVGKLFVDTPPRSSGKVMAVNADAVLFTTRAFLGPMVERNDGHVVTIASMAGLMGCRKLVDYCASKFAAYGFMESLAVELHGEGKHGVKTTVVCPYFIATGMFAGAQGRFPWLLPTTTPEYIADTVVDAMLKEQDFVVAPRIMWAFYFTKPFLPTAAAMALSDFVGVTRCMDPFVGRNKKE